MDSANLDFPLSAFASSPYHGSSGRWPLWTIQHGFCRLYKNFSPSSWFPDFVYPPWILSYLTILFILFINYPLIYNFYHLSFIIIFIFIIYYYLFLFHFTSFYFDSSKFTLHSVSLQSHNIHITCPPLIWSSCSFHVATILIHYFTHHLTVSHIHAPHTPSYYFPAIPFTLHHSSHFHKLFWLHNKTTHPHNFYFYLFLLIYFSLFFYLFIHHFSSFFIYFVHHFYHYHNSLSPFSF